jgi:hypothetical protein
VQRTREALGLPAPKPCRPLPKTLEEAFRQHTKPTADGHLTWTGPTTEGVPRLKFGGKVHYARRVAFRFHYGRDPIGKAIARCEVNGCVAGRCIEDQPMRERAKSLYAAIFGAEA